MQIKYLPMQTQIQNSKPNQVGQEIVWQMANGMRHEASGN